MQWGYKQTCGAYTKPDNENCHDARACIWDECNWNTQVLKEDGTCLTCGEFTRPDGTDMTNRICKADDCDIGYILKTDGTCQECGPWTHPDSEARTCIKDACDYTVEKLLVTGTCETCEEYTYPVPLDEAGDSKDCMTDPCAYET